MDSAEEMDANGHGHGYDMNGYWVSVYFTQCSQIK